MKPQKILIIGGSSGMGLAAALHLHKVGYEVAIASRSRKKLDQAAQTIGSIETHVLDVTQESQVKTFFSSIQAFDHLIISAADFVMGPFLELEISEARRFFDSKFWGQYTVAKYAASKIKVGGSITFFSGIAGQKPSIGLTVASAINAALEGLTRALCLELSPIRVNAISPGTISTPVWEIVPEKERLAYFKEAGQKLPVGRIGRSEDIAHAVKFLIECPFITGDILYCDGGARYSG